MKKRVLKWVGLLLILIVMFIAFVMIYKVSDRVRYLEKMFDIEIRDKVKDVDGTIKPGFSVFTFDSMQLKVTVNKEDKKSFLTVLNNTFYVYDNEFAKEELERGVNDTFQKFSEEIKKSDIKYCYVTWITKDVCSRPRYIYVTDQDGEMVVYFMDIF